jgi:hypothetical protein
MMDVQAVGIEDWPEAETAFGFIADRIDCYRHWSCLSDEFDFSPVGKLTGDYSEGGWLNTRRYCGKSEFPATCHSTRDQIFHDFWLGYRTH